MPNHHHKQFSVHITQVPLPLCPYPYSDPTRLVSHGVAWPLRLAGRPAPLRSALGSREKGYN